MPRRIAGPCTTPGCPGRATRRGKCDRHKVGTTDRGYGTGHQALRARWQRRIDAGEVVICWRCGRTRIQGTAWHLGHDDADRRITRGPECMPCNLGA